MAEITPALVEQLAAKCYDVVPPAELASALQAVGITDANALTGASAEKLLTALNAQAVVAITVSFFLGSQPRERGPKASPAFGLTGRMFGSSCELLLWSLPRGQRDPAAKPRSPRLTKA